MKIWGLKSYCDCLYSPKVIFKPDTANFEDAQKGKDCLKVVETTKDKDETTTNLPRWQVSMYSRKAYNKSVKINKLSN